LRRQGSCKPVGVVDTCILIGLALEAGAVLPICPFPTAAAAIATLIVLRRSLSKASSALALAALLLGALRGGTAVANFDRERAQAREMLGGPSRCAAFGTVASSPILLHQTPPALAIHPIDAAPTPQAPFVASWDADLERVDCDGRALARPFRARIYGGPHDLARGDRVFLIADLAPVQLFRNEDLDDPRPGGARRGVMASGGAHDVRIIARGKWITTLIDRFRARVRRRILATFEIEAIPMARALVLGESDLDDADNQAFRVSGLAHLLAVSGTHLVLVVVGAVAAIDRVLRRVVRASARWDVGRWSAGWGVGFSWIYADFAGGSGSANRAAAMLSFALGAKAWGRRPDGPRAFGLSLLAAAIVDPLVVFDVSFLLSVAATAGLMVLQRPIAARFDSLLPPLADRKLPQRASAALFAALATTLSASLGCAPLIAFISPTLPIGGLAANLLAVPVGELIALPLCLAHTLLGFVPPVEHGDALVASGSLLVVRAIARTTAQITWLSLPVPRPTAWQCCLLFVSSVGAWAASGRRRTSVVLAGAASLLAVEGLTMRAGAPRDKLRITVLDVGQGDGMIVDFPDGQAMLVDGGGMVGSPVDTGRSVVLPMLRARRRTDIATVVLSHPHPDHFGGLASAVGTLRVDEFWDTGQGEREGAGPVYAALLEGLRARGVRVMRPDALCGHPRDFGKAKVEVLAPCPEPVPFVNANDNSFVLRITYGAQAALLVGDAEHGEEDGLLARGRDLLRADLLKVGHHGSATSSSPAFVEAVGARDSIISCGVRNRFGHPHPATLRTLLDATRVWRTDRNGSVRWETDGSTASVATASGVVYTSTPRMRGTR
jgi:competence protein ComEC